MGKYIALNLTNFCTSFLTSFFIGRQTDIKTGIKHTNKQQIDIQSDIQLLYNVECRAPLRETLAPTRRRNLTLATAGVMRYNYAGCYRDVS